MAYVPNPADFSEPVITRPAGSAAEEFRKLKEYVNTLVLAAGRAAGVRQTVLQGVTDANGNASLMSAGTGLALSLTATARAVVFAFAAGFSAAAGAVDSYSQLTADAADVVAGLSASNTSYIHATRVSNSAVTWGKTLVPPDYSYAFDKARGSILNFEGVDGAVATTDDFGNSWTFSGNAQIDTAQFKFGASSLLLDGTGDFIESTGVANSFRDGAWEISCWFRLNATSVVHGIFALCNAADFGAVVQVQHNAGNRRLQLDLSSNGTADDIVNAGVGASTTIALNTWYKVRLVCDPLAGNYKLFLSNNGAAETLELTTASTAKICTPTKLSIGNIYQAGGAFNGWIDAFRFINCNTNPAVEAPAAAAPAITDYPYHWFSIPEMKMYEVTAASAAAGTNPTLTAVERVFVAECDTNAGAVTATRNYAYRGQYTGPLVAPLPGTNTTVSQSHNIGTAPKEVSIDLVNITPEVGYVPGDILKSYSIWTSDAGGRAPATFLYDKKTASLVTGATVAFAILNKTTGAGATLTAGRWAYRFVANRGW